MIDDRKNSIRRRVNVLVAISLLAIGLAWIFFGAVSDKDGRVKVALAMAKAREVQSAIATYYADRKVLPPNNEALRLPGKESRPYLTATEQDAELSFAIVVKNGTLTLTFASGQEPVSGKTLVFVPGVAEGGLAWTCDKGTVDARYRPTQCR